MQAYTTIYVRVEIETKRRLRKRVQRAMIMPDALDERNEDQNAPECQGAIDEAIAAERQRAAAVDAVFVPFVGQDVQALKAQAIAESWDEGTARQRLLDHLGIEDYNEIK